MPHQLVSFPQLYKAQQRTAHQHRTTNGHVTNALLLRAVSKQDTVITTDFGTLTSSTEPSARIPLVTLCGASTSTQTPKQ